MTLPRIEERTFYEPIVKYLNESGFQAVGNTKILDKEPDVLFKYGSQKFVIEVKIGKPDQIGVKAIAQAYDYGRKLETQNIIIVIYPEEIRNETISDYSIIPRFALETKATVISLTEVWTESLDITLESFFTQLKENIEQSKTKFDFATTVKLIERYASDLNSVVYQIKTDELVSEVVNKLDLFTSVGEIKDKETAKRQVVNLASFLFFNQLLFYHIYKKKARASNLPELEEIKEIDDIKFYFGKITEVDFQAIYKVDLISHLPNKKDVIGVINDIIKAIKLLRAEHITHDLAGRFFHDLIPFEVRKILAAFYTHPNAADLLANLAIDRWDETVIDPACGSGTLLVASYNRKRELYEKLYGFTKANEMHKKFIENDLTGIDLMPFAAHISAINLTMQNIEEQTNTLRIATMDSLELAESLKLTSFRRNGIKLSPFATQLQRTLDEVEFAKVKKIKGSVSPEGRGFEFYLKPVDIVIMNPPFSDRDKMPKEIREKIRNNKLSRICGNQVNLWGYFLALADLMLKPNGKIAAVIPINFARGGATEKIRNFLIKHYHIKYIIKPVKDLAFSESAAFRDILLIAQKKIPTSSDITKIIFLKKSIKQMKENEVKQIISFNKEYVDIKEVTFKEILSKKGNLMPLLTPERFQNNFTKFIHSTKLTSFNSDWINIGLPYRPKGVADAVFITNPSDRSRIKNAFSILTAIEPKEIIVTLKHVSKEIEELKVKKEFTKFALRTNTGIKKISVDSKDLDLILTEKHNDYLLSLKKLNRKIPIPFPWEKHLNKNIITDGFYLLIPRKIRLDSPNTYVISIFSEEKLYSAGPSLYYFKAESYSKEELKILNLYLNSVLTIIQIFLYKSETLGGGYFELMKSDWNRFKVIDINKLNRDEKYILLELFEKLSKVEIPPIIEQFENRFWARIELDRTILKILGFSNKEIDEWLPEIYDIIVEELKTIGEVGKTE